ncbi:unnamed protein product [Pylaiella littoralis]
MDAPINATQLLLGTRTSTDGSVSPKPRWAKGSPPTKDETVVTADKAAQQECTTPITSSSSTADEEGPSSLPPLRSESGSDATSSNNGENGRKAYAMAWRWLVEDEATSEPKLQRPTTDIPVELPHLDDAERELLCRHTELRLREVGRQSADISALVDEYLRFMFLRNRLENMLSLDPSLLVDDVWQAHITSGSEYDAFCERTFDGQPLEFGMPHRNIDPSQPVLYGNTVGAYEHFFGVCPPAESWPAPQVVEPALDGEEGIDTSGRRRALVRSSEEKFHFTKDSSASSKSQ